MRWHALHLSRCLLFLSFTPLPVCRRACGCPLCKWSTETSQWCAAAGAISQGITENSSGGSQKSLVQRQCRFAGQQRQVRKALPAMRGAICSGANCQCRHAQTVAAVHAVQEADALVGQRAVPSMKNAAVDAFKKLTLQVWQRALTALHFC